MFVGLQGNVMGLTCMMPIFLTIKLCMLKFHTNEVGTQGWNYGENRIKEILSGDQSVNFYSFMSDAELFKKSNDLNDKEQWDW